MSGGATAPLPCHPGLREMERLKRRLDRVPALLGGARRVRLCGLPPPEDAEGALRLEGVAALLAAHGLAVEERPPRTGRAEPALWLGGEVGELPRLARGAPVLLWPPADAPPAHVAAALGARPGARLLLAHPEAAPPGQEAMAMPDPAHALWGLLDHHPQGAGVLAVGGDHPWAALLPPGRVALARRIARLHRGLRLPLGRPAALARRRLLEAARRVVAAHAEVETDRPGASLFAALLGRPARLRGAAAAYWRAWGAA
ncbi:hypothetical protein [Crenalkalicoccus roseus]|uniref:hypothetical protein n=1 Tax=Crenalkalicoccus roseus TaxID=1485588 RepID=UPI00130547BD|nr:hypothetical protein [Crenalkalicoccus roseus]